MDQRKQRILEAIVALYGTGGEPVGSGLLCRYFDMAVSSATLRNEMAVLTKLGLLEQPHTSAGRVPSAKGYRYYIDNILDNGATLSQAECRRIDEAISELDMQPDNLARSAAALLSNLTGYTAAVTTPAADDMTIAHFEVVQVGRYAAAVLAVTSGGDVLSRVARVGRGFTREDAARLAGLLNRGLTFISPADMSSRLLTAFAAELAPDSEALMPVVMAAAALLQSACRPRAYLSGSQMMLNWPDTRESLGMLLELFDNGEDARRLITPPGKRPGVLLGEDFADPMPGVCIVGGRYLAGGGLEGSTAIIGPTRMPFNELLPLLTYFNASLGRYMSGVAN